MCFNSRCVLKQHKTVMRCLPIYLYQNENTFWRTNIFSERKKGKCGMFVQSVHLRWIHTNRFQLVLLCSIFSRRSVLCFPFIWASVLLIALPFFHHHAIFIVNDIQIWNAIFVEGMLFYVFWRFSEITFQFHFFFLCFFLEMTAKVWWIVV